MDIQISKYSYKVTRPFFRDLFNFSLFSHLHLSAFCLSSWSILNHHLFPTKMIFPFVALLALSTTVQAVPVPGNNEIRPEKMAEQVNPASPSQVFPLVSSSSTPANAPHKSDHNRHIRSSKDRESDLFEPGKRVILSSEDKLSVY